MRQREKQEEQNGYDEGDYENNYGYDDDYDDNGNNDKEGGCSVKVAMNLPRNPCSVNFATHHSEAYQRCSCILRHLAQCSTGRDIEYLG